MENEGLVVRGPYSQLKRLRSPYEALPCRMHLSIERASRLQTTTTPSILHHTSLPDRHMLHAGYTSYTTSIYALS